MGAIILSIFTGLGNNHILTNHKTSMRYTTINIQGNLISEEILQKIESTEAHGQSAEHFGFEKGSNLRTEIEYAWSRIKLDWKHHKDKMDNIAESDPYGTAISMRWMESFLAGIGFDLSRQKSNLIGENGQSYPISHVAENLDSLPVHITGFTTRDRAENKNTLDIKSREGASKFSPQGMVQEYLNVTEHVYGIATNGYFLRLIRDSGRLVKMAYIELNIKKLLDEDKYSEFNVLYRLIHASRFPKSRNETQQSILETYYRESIETGNRIREELSDAVKKSLLALGNGFLQHPANEKLRLRMQSGDLTPKEYYRQLLRIIYRLLFLMVTEDRKLIHDENENSPEATKKKNIYYDYYSIARLRKLSLRRYLYESQYHDLWAGLINTFRMFDIGSTGIRMDIKPLGGNLFDLDLIRDLLHSTLSNHLLLECIKNLSEFKDVQGNLVQINYQSLDVEELGSVYEGLLDLHPVIQQIDNHDPSQIVFTFHEGTDRKTTGSYYTRPDLVNELIKSALIPVIEDRLKKAEGKANRMRALLQLKVCDPAAGSGHMMLAAARTIAWYLARIESEEDNPAPSVFRKCLREVIQHCIYAVDMNPDAVELCKLAFWLESHNSGKPLSFLDHKIKNGNSLVGVTDLSVLSRPLPDDAFNPVSGDDRGVCQELKRRNATFKRSPQTDLFSSFGESIKVDTTSSVKAMDEIEWTSQDTLEGVDAVKNRFEKLRAGQYYEEKACHIWTSAYFKTYTHVDDNTNPTSERIAQFFTSPSQYGQLVGESTALAEEHQFFHWPLAFPDVYNQGGFDVMLGNPPWEIIELKEQEFFSTKDQEIADAENKSARTRLIEKLRTKNPTLYNGYIKESHYYDSVRKFLKYSGRNDLTAVGRINTYSVFAENFSNQINTHGRTGFIVPTGIATDDGNKNYFGSLIEQNKLISLFDFENSKAIFPGVHRSYKFCLLTLSGQDIGKQKSKFGFSLTEIDHLQDEIRIFNLSKDDFLRINPNTKTCPVFRTRMDAELTTKIYKRIPILINEKTGENPWGITFKQGLFNMSSDSYLFRTLPQLEEEGFDLWGNRMRRGDEVWLPLYEAKMIWHYDHRFGSYAGVTSRTYTQTPTPTLEKYQDPTHIILPWYWVKEKLVSEQTDKNWFIGFRDVTNNTNERTFVTSLFPRSAVNHKLPILLPGAATSLIPHFIGLTSSLVFDYCARQKIGGTSMTFFNVKQFPVPSPSTFINNFTLRGVQNILELVYTSWDIKSFSDSIWKEGNAEMQNFIHKQWEENKYITGGHSWDPPEWCTIDPDGCPLPPFKWDEDRRAVLKAELDAIYAHLYGLTTEELRYILDPQDVYGPDFPGETFRVLKEKEIRHYGEYRTKRLVMEAWERMGYNNTAPH